jgi:hypothetical protein
MPSDTRSGCYYTIELGIFDNLHSFETISVPEADWTIDTHRYDLLLFFINPGLKDFRSSVSFRDGPDDTEGIGIIDHKFSISASSDDDANFDWNVKASDLSMLALLSTLVWGWPQVVCEGKGIEDF